MRFSAVQEDGYGVGLGQETPPNDEDESMMAATGDVEPGGGCAIEEGSMISNLPLLFANGYPTSLEKITLPELERFVTFMVQCSLGHDKAEVLSEPQWWPKEIKFSNPLVKPKKINENYMANLKKLVFRCYTYHRSEYLLRFCSYLAQYPHDKLEYVNNWDSTTSLYLKTTGKLLVTFRNENMNYDRKIIDSRRMLLPLKKTKTTYTNITKCLRRRSAQKQAPSPAMVEPPMDDIYLCDNCDAEFIGLCKMKEHEKLCYRVEPRPITPEAEVVPEIQQDQFMEYFNLKSSKLPDQNRGGSSVVFNKDITQNRTSSRIRSSVNLTRCPTIPFSSPAGLALGKKSKMMTESIQQERLERIERHLSAPPLSTSFKPKWFVKTYEFDRWAVTYKPNRDRTSKSDEYVHRYKFGNYSGKPALDLRSQLLFVACKPIYVEVARLTDEEIEELKRDPSRYRSPERKIPRIRPRSPSVEPVDDSELGDEVCPIIIDLVDDDEEEVQENQIAEIQPARLPVLMPTPMPTPMITPRPTLMRTAMPTPTPTTVLLPTFQPIVSSMPRVATVTPIRASVEYQLTTRSPASGPKQASKRLRSSKSIIFVDLCSSDDEVEELEPESSPWCVSTDENCDPSATFVRNSLLSPSKLCTKPCIYPADSTSGWLTNLNVDGDSQCRDKPFFKHGNVLTSTP